MPPINVVTQGTQVTQPQQQQQHAGTLPQVHSFLPVPTIKRFDGVRPSELAAILADCENAVHSASPSLDKGSVPFSNACLANVVHRLDMSKDSVNSAYQLWRTSPNPTWTTLKLELHQYFLTPFYKAAQANAFIHSAVPTGADRNSLLKHVALLNEPFRVLAQCVSEDEDLKMMWDFKFLHCIRNFEFMTSLIKVAPASYHCVLLDKLSVKDSPSLTCTKLSEAITQLIPRHQGMQVSTAAAVSQQQDEQTHDELMYFEEVPHTRSTKTIATLAPMAAQPKLASGTKSVSWVPQLGSCFNCGDLDHKSPDCIYKPYCWYCQKEGHPWNQCRIHPEAIKATKAAINQPQGFQKGKFGRSRK